MTNEQLLSHVADVLRAVSDGNYPEDWCPRVGLCTNLEGVLDAEDCDDAQYDFVYEVVTEGMRLWPAGTGNDVYPVPGSPDALHGTVWHQTANVHTLAADCYSFAPDMYTGTYGKSRRALAAWLADYLESQEI